MAPFWCVATAVGTDRDGDEDNTYFAFTPNERRQLRLAGLPLMYRHGKTGDKRSFGKVVCSWYDPGTNEVRVYIAIDRKNDAEIQIAEYLKSEQYGLSLAHITIAPIPLENGKYVVLKKPIEVTVTPNPRRGNCCVHFCNAEKKNKMYNSNDIRNIDALYCRQAKMTDLPGTVQTSDLTREPSGDFTAQVHPVDNDSNDATTVKEIVTAAPPEIVDELKKTYNHNVQLKQEVQKLEEAEKSLLAKLAQAEQNLLVLKSTAEKDMADNRAFVNSYLTKHTRSTLEDDPLIAEAISKDPLPWNSMFKLVMTADKAKDEQTQKEIDKQRPRAPVDQDSFRRHFMSQFSASNDDGYALAQPQKKRKHFPLQDITPTTMSQVQAHVNKIRANTERKY